MELAYRCRDAPQQFEGEVEVDEDGTFILVYTDRGRVRIPLQVGLRLWLRVMLRVALGLGLG